MDFSHETYLERVHKKLNVKIKKHGKFTIFRQIKNKPRDINLLDYLNECNDLKFSCEKISYFNILMEALQPVNYVKRFLFSYQYDNNYNFNDATAEDLIELRKYNIFPESNKEINNECLINSKDKYGLYINDITLEISIRCYYSIKKTIDKFYSFDEKFNNKSFLLFKLKKLIHNAFINIDWKKLLELDILQNKGEEDCDIKSNIVITNYEVLENIIPDYLVESDKFMHYILDNNYICFLKSINKKKHFKWSPSLFIRLCNTNEKFTKMVHEDYSFEIEPEFNKENEIFNMMIELNKLFHTDLELANKNLEEVKKYFHPFIINKFIDYNICHKINSKSGNS